MRRLAALLFLFAVSPLALPQMRAPIEDRIAQLPPEERAVQRYRWWLSGQELEVRNLADAERYGRYRVWLREGGFSEPDIEGQIAAVAKAAAQPEVERWNRMFTDAHPTFNTNPNSYLVEVLTAETAKGRKPGRALDVAMGQGRNSIWLAQQGWDVTGFDPADKAVEVANQTAAGLGLKIHTEIATMEEFDFGENRWDLILLSYAGCTEIAQQVEKALKPGGILIVEAFHTDALKSFHIGGSLCGPGQLPHAFQNLRVLRYEEPIARPDFAPGPARVVRFSAVK